ncbi:cupin domain-containing protein [Enterococcus alishanensis]
MSQAKLEGRIFKLDEIAKFDEAAAKKNFFYETERTAGAIWCLHPGQELVEHSHKAADDLWICLRGKGTFYPGDDAEVEISAGDMIISKPGDHHGVKNTGDEPFMFIGVAGPNPLDFIPNKPQ